MQPYVFGEAYQIHGLSRNSSFVSNEGGESGRSPSNNENQAESQSSADELPPTPTKPNTAITNSRQNSLRSNLLGRRPSIGLSAFVPPNSLDEQISPQPSLRKYKNTSSWSRCDEAGLSCPSSSA